MKKLDLSIIIVNYNTREDLKNCIDSIYHFTKGLTFKIFVVDNASSDGSCEMVEKNFKQVILIRNKKNRYCTAGNNQVLRIAKSTYCLVINPDIELVDNALSEMMNFLQTHQNVAAVSCQMILPNGKTDMKCTRFLTPWYEFQSNCIGFKPFKNQKLIDQYLYSDWKRTTVRQVDAISDIIMMIRTDAVQQLNGYDEHLLLYFMEDDLSVRLNQIGYEVWHLGTTKVKHKEGQSTKQFLPEAMYPIFEQDMLYYFRKHFGYGWWAFMKLTFLTNRLYYVIAPLRRRFNT